MSDPATGLLSLGAVLAEATVLYVGYGRLSRAVTLRIRRAVGE